MLRRLLLTITQVKHPRLSASMARTSGPVIRSERPKQIPKKEKSAHPSNCGGQFNHKLRASSAGR